MRYQARQSTVHNLRRTYRSVRSNGCRMKFSFYYVVEEVHVLVKEKINKNRIGCELLDNQISRYNVKQKPSLVRISVVIMASAQLWHRSSQVRI